MERTDSQVRELREDMDRLELGTTDVIPSPPSDGSIDNLIDDGDYSYSHAAYTTAGVTPGAAGDDNNRAFNWYRIERATPLMVEDNVHALKGPAHSLFGAETADTPRWDKANGWAELGETGGTAWDICCPLPHNFVIPGWRYNLQMLCRLRTSTALPGAIQLAWAFHDNTNTPPAPRVIQGAPLTLSGGVFGGTGATTRQYKLIIDTDQGGQVESDILTINNAPAVLSATNGVNLSWLQIPGFTRVTIYVTVAGATFIAGFVGNGAGAFQDTGQNFGAVLGGFPSVTDTVAKAYAVARNFAPTTEWQRADFTIFVPQNYNASLTTGRQWLRGSVIGLMGDPHQLQIDRIGVSTGTGVWSPSARDKIVTSLPSTTMTSSQQQPPGSGFSPPGDGEGRIACSTFDTPIDVCDHDGKNPRKVDLGEIDDEAIARGIYLVSAKNKRPNRVTKQRTAFAKVIVTIKTKNGSGRRCSESDLWLLVNGPEAGTPARRLSKGVEVWTRQNGSVKPSEITVYSKSRKGEQVRILETDGDRTYWAGDAGAHNAKLESPNIF